MKKHKHTHPTPKDFTGVSDAPHVPEEPAHKPLARGALHKAAKAFKEGEITPDEFDQHVKRAHGRLHDYGMMAAMPTPPTPAKKRKRKS